jgi:hypothetical protein
MLSHHVPHFTGGLFRLQHVTPEEEYVLVLDSDMIQRRPFLVEVMKPKLGLAVGARYTYMIGVNNELALRHVPGAYDQADLADIDLADIDPLSHVLPRSLFPSCLRGPSPQ